MDIRKFALTFPEKEMIRSLKQSRVSINKSCNREKDVQRAKLMLASSNEVYNSIKYIEENAVQRYRKVKGF